MGAEPAGRHASNGMWRAADSCWQIYLASPTLTLPPLQSGHSPAGALQLLCNHKPPGMGQELPWCLASRLTACRQWVQRERLGDLDDAPPDKSAVPHGQLPLPVQQHAHSLPPGQRKGQLGQRSRMAVLPAARASLLGLRLTRQYSVLLKREIQMRGWESGSVAVHPV